MVYSGQEVAEFGPVNVSRLVEDIANLLKITISKHAILRTDLGEDLPSVRGHAPQLRQVVMNLMMNASEAIGEKEGVISISTSQVFGGKDLVPGKAELTDGGYVILEVSDTGHGMTEDVKKRALDPYFTTKRGGHGLGLAVVQGIVRAHGGAINLSSAPGQGTTFQIFLPCSGEPVKKPENSKTQPTADRASQAAGTVLIVEDEDSLRRSIAKMLNTKGFSVVEAADGTRALELLRGYSNEIDAMLLDLTIPGASSHDVEEEARRTRPGMRIVFTSAFGPEAVRRSIGGAHGDFIRKPFRMDELVRLLREPVSR
jgi:CheY-like chemotaxis protein/two-component sensor histidine kinase